MPLLRSWSQHSCYIFWKVWITDQFFQFSMGKYLRFRVIVIRQIVFLSSTIVAVSIIIRCFLPYSDGAESIRCLLLGTCLIIESNLGYTFLCLFFVKKKLCNVYFAKITIINLVIRLLLHDFNCRSHGLLCNAWVNRKYFWSNERYVMPNYTFGIGIKI